MREEAQTGLQHGNVVPTWGASKSFGRGGRTCIDGHVQGAPFNPPLCRPPTSHAPRPTPHAPRHTPRPMPHAPRLAPCSCLLMGARSSLEVSGGSAAALADCKVGPGGWVERVVWVVCILRPHNPGCVSVSGFDLTPLCPTLRYVTLRYVTLRYVTLRYVTLRYVTLRYVTLRYVTLRYVTLRYVTLRRPGSNWGNYV